MSSITQLAHVFLTDDDEDDKDLFGEAFREIAPNLHFSTACNCEEFMEQLMSFTLLPDLAILDLNMPGMTGFECLVEIRQSSILASLPVLVYSTTSNAEQVERAYRHGANLYMQKPSHYQGIKKMIEYVLSLDPHMYIPQASRDEFLLKF